MKFPMIAAVCGVLALAGEAQAQEAAPASIVVVGQGHAEAAPDTFAMTADIEGRGADQAEAVHRMVLAQTAVTDDISRLKGLTAARVTTGLPSVSPVYGADCEPHNRGKGCTPTAYVATLAVMMEGRPAERGGDAVSLAAERGARNARLTGLSLSSDDEVRRQATRAAVADARRQADDIAEGSGQRVVRMLRVEQAGSSDPFYGARMEDDRLFVFGLYNYSEAETPIALTPGPVDVRANLQVTFEIE